jgi:lysozyme
MWTRLGLACALLVAGCGDATVLDEHVGQVSSAIVICPDGDTQEGIDVSHFQGTIDWNAVAADGVAFAIARASDGDLKDPEFGTNWQSIKDVGMLRGAYQFFRPGGDPEEQARLFIDEVGVLGPGDLPGMIDVESTDRLLPSEIAANVATWVEMVSEATGRVPIIYTGSYFWNDNVQTDEFADNPLWVAHYTNSCPNVPDAWPAWTIWQYTAIGSVAGIGGNVPRNLFNGSVEQLHDLAGNGLRASVVSVDYPSTMAPGETATVKLVLENLGARTWTANTMLGTSMPRDRDSDFAAASWDTPQRAAAVPLDVLSGGTVTIEFDITAPAETGQYTEHFNLVEEGFAWFSDTPPGGGPSDDAIALGIMVEGDTLGAGGSGGGGETSVGDGGGCSIGRAPRHDSWWLLALSGIATAAARRRRTPRCRRPR